MDDELNFGVTLDNQNPDDGDTQRKLAMKAMSDAQTGPSSHADVEDISMGRDDYNLSRALHPKMCIATVAFKGAAFIMYFIFGLFLSRVITFIFVTILGATDFWVVKNLSGRILVGLRWWSSYNEKGEEVWKF